ncbi:MAG: hypothetical protein GTN59_11465 [Candidatus Dadabacteria bacterium]|nr:hypothetical protein [Candidatus Dadabacteria bacterium]
MTFFEIAGKNFYLDIEEISDYVKIEPDEDTIEDILNEMSLPEDDVNGEIEEQTHPMQLIPHGQVFDVAKWEIVRAMIETLLQENGVIDEDMGITRLGKQLSIPFRLSFNTLQVNGLIKEKLNG